jgi:hypothetical protein
VSPFRFEAESGSIPVGDFDVKIVEAVSGTNSKGNPNLRVVFEAPDGAQIADWLVHLPTVRWKWEQLWEAAGLEFPVGPVEVDERDLVGKRVHIDVIEDSYQGQTRTKVKEVTGPVGMDVPIDFPESDTAADTDGSFAAAAGLEDDDSAPY